MITNEEDFKAIPHLRWHLDSDRTPIAKSNKRKLKQDHLYFHGVNKLAIYWTRPTKMQAIKARYWWKQRIIACHGRVILEYPGDFDGITVFEPGEVPSEFLRSTTKGFSAKPAMRPDAASGNDAERSDGVQVPSDPPEPEKSPHRGPGAGKQKKPALGRHEDLEKVIPVCPATSPDPNPGLEAAPVPARAPHLTLPDPAPDPDPDPVRAPE